MGAGKGDVSTVLLVYTDVDDGIGATAFGVVAGAVG
jgi:hypothetical protein